MSGARGGKGLVWYIFSYAKGEKMGPGGHDPQGPPGSATDYISHLIYVYILVHMCYSLVTLSMQNVMVISSVSILTLF